MQQQINFLDLLSGKTFQEPLVATKDATSKPSSKRFVKSGGGATLLYLSLRKDDGCLLGASWETVTALPGVSSTLNITECPSDARESTLSQILILNAPEKYNLSVKACAGILRRAQKRGKELPPMLREALLEVVNACDLPEPVGQPDQADISD